MTRNRKPYETATTLDQAFLDECFANLTNQIEMVVEIELPGSAGWIYASDRNKYVDEIFYEALLSFPVIERTIGEWLSGELDFSTLELELSNVDGRFNPYLPGGNYFNGWIGRVIFVKVGLRNVESTYKTIFKGEVTQDAGWGRTRKSMKLTARDAYDSVNRDYPNTVFLQATYPNIEEDKIGTIVPVVYGDWTVYLTENAASVPSFPVNGADANVIGGSRSNVDIVVSYNVNTVFDSSNVFLRRGGVFYKFTSSDVTNVHANKNRYQVKQDTGATLIEGVNYLFEQGDEFFVRINGKPLTGGYDRNPVYIARDILIAYGNLFITDFDSSWEVYRDELETAGFHARLWIQEPLPALSSALSILEQVRLEAFVDRNLKWKISSLWFEHFNPTPNFTIENWDIVADSFQPSIDLKNNFNRARAAFCFLPDIGENNYQTEYWRNQAAMDQAKRAITKRLVYPNLYDKATVEYQMQETLKLSSCYIEQIECELTWRALLLDISDFVLLNVGIQSLEYSEVPCLIRKIGYDPSGMKIPVTLWPMQMVPFIGYTPGYAGTVGGYNAIITKET